MIDDTNFELIQRVLDGEASDHEKTELDQLLAENQDVQHLYVSMRRMVRQLDQMEPVEPRPQLESRIKSVVRSHAAAKGRVPLVERLHRFAGSLLTPRVGFSFATGIAAGLVLFAATNSYFNPPGNLDSNNMSGTIMMEKAVSTHPHVVENVEFEAGVISFVGKIAGSAEIIEVTSDIASPISVTFEFAPDEFTFDGIQGVDYARGTLSHAPGRITIEAGSILEVSIEFISASDKAGEITYMVKLDNEIRTGIISRRPKN